MTEPNEIPGAGMLNLSQAGRVDSMGERGDWVAVPDPADHDTGRGRRHRKNRRPSVLDDKRAQPRFSQRELGIVAVAVQLPGGAWTPVHLWDFTSTGFGILLALPEVEAADERRFRVGEELQLRIRPDGNQEFEVSCEIKNAKPYKGKIKVGLRRKDMHFPRAVDIDRRDGFRLAVAPALALKARIRHPFIYGHWCGLQVSDLNKSMGFSFTSSDESVLVFEGMELLVHFELASFRQIPMRARVVWVNANGDAGGVRFGAVCVSMDFGLHNGICDYLMYSRQWTPARLFSAGFRAQHVKNHLRFRSVKSMEDYAEVLGLRREAYVGAGKRPGETRPEDMASPLDGKSRILMAHHHGRLVGTLTFTFPSSEETILDSQAGFPGSKYPVAVPPKANLIEVSRLCIHHEYRGADVLQGLFEHGLKHFLMSDRHWLLTSAMDELLPIYERIGFRRLRASYKHPRLNNKEHHLILASRRDFLGGFGINPVVWNAVFGDLVRYMLSKGLVRITTGERVLIRAKLLLQPFSKFLLSRKAQRAFRQHLDTLRLFGFRSESLAETLPEADATVPKAASHGAPADPSAQAR